MNSCPEHKKSNTLKLQFQTVIQSLKKFKCLDMLVLNSVKV